MNTDVLQRFRDGLNSGRFTLTKVQKATDIPLATLSDMSDDKWRPKVFDRLENLAQALDAIEAEAPATSEQGRASTAA